ncbi:hypothetical protein [Virgibacillus sp.]|nr:hypothetical protein [Virgibacillus sp.]
MESFDTATIVFWERGGSSSPEESVRLQWKVTGALADTILMN